MVTIGKYKISTGETFWRVRYSKPDGKTTDKRGFLRKIDAERWAAEHVTIAKASGSFTPVSAGKIRLDALYDAWVAQKKLIWKPSTFAVYDGAWRNHVRDTYGRKRIGDVTQESLQAWIVSLVESGCGPTLTRRCADIVRGVLSIAVRDHMIATNPAKGLVLPKKKARQRVYLSSEQLMLLADCANTLERRMLILTMGLCGLRWGEAAALEAGDVDLRKHRIDVTKALMIINGRYTIGTPKSDESRRVVYTQSMHDGFKELLKGRKKHDLLFSIDGSPIRWRSPNDRACWYYWTKKRAADADPDFPITLTFHDLRHTAASLMVSAGASVKAVQRQLGHASASMTLDVYADLFDSDLDGIAQAVDNLLLENRGHSVGTTA